MTAVFFALLGATACMRLVEVAVSVRRMRARPDAVVAEPGLFPAMVALHVAFVALPAVEVLALGRAVWWPLALAAIGALALATGLRIWTLRTIGRAWNVRVVAPPPDGIATTGPYAWIRHPNYLVVALEILSLPLVHSAWISAAVLTLGNALVLARRIRTEERVLAQNPAWVRAFADKARLVPGLF